MALLRPFTDACGNAYAASYWRAVSINIIATEQKIHLVFYGYKDSESFASGKQALPGAVKSYSIAGAEFAAIAAAAPVGATLYDALAAAAEGYAAGKLDTPASGGGMASFFDGSQRA